jgi:hypothetical protein
MHALGLSDVELEDSISNPSPWYQSGGGPADAWRANTTRSVVYEEPSSLSVQLVAELSSFDPSSWSESVESERPLIGLIDGRVVVVSWGIREQGSLAARAPWERTPPSSPSLSISGDERVHDLRVAVMLHDPRLMQLMGLTTVNMVDPSRGFDGSIWTDLSSPQRPLFLGREVSGDLAGLGAALTIGAGFRVTLLDGLCFLDSLGPAAAYTPEHIEQAIAYVAGLETQLVSMIETAFEPNCAAPNPIIARLAIREPSDAATDALYRIVFEQAECGETQAALKELVRRRDTSSLRQELIRLFLSKDTSNALSAAILRCAHFDEATLIELLSAYPLGTFVGAAKELALLEKLAQVGGQAALQVIGARLAERPDATLENPRIRAHEQARLTIVARLGDSQGRGLAIASDDVRGVALSLPEADTDRSSTLERLVAGRERRGAATQTADESESEPVH